MSFRRIEADCPGCQAKVSFDVDVPDPQVKLIEDSTRVNELTHEVTGSQQTIEALRRELHNWQSGENHLQARDMLHMLQSCPDCRPTLDAFIGNIRHRAVSDLNVDQVKELARRHKLWPPPTIDLGPWLSRAR
jgi:hypothetical protein